MSGLFFSLRNKESNKGESSLRRLINVAQGSDTRTIFCRIGHVNPKAIRTHGLITQYTESLSSSGPSLPYGELGFWMYVIVAFILTELVPKGGYQDSF